VSPAGGPDQQDEQRPRPPGLDVEVEGRRLCDRPFRDLKRRHALALVAHMLSDRGGAPSGAQNVLRTLSAMAEDAITDEVADVTSPAR
jgi:hypothetical protein